MPLKRLPHQSTDVCTCRYRVCPNPLSVACLCPSVRLSVCPSVRLSLCPSVRLSVCPSVRLSVCPSVSLSLCLSVSLSLCLSVCVYIIASLFHSLVSRAVCIVSGAKRKMLTRWQLTNVAARFDHRHSHTHKSLLQVTMSTPMRSLTSSRSSSEEGWALRRKRIGARPAAPSGALHCPRQQCDYSELWYVGETLNCE